MPSVSSEVASAPCPLSVRIVSTVSASCQHKSAFEQYGVLDQFYWCQDCQYAVSTWVNGVSTVSAPCQPSVRIVSALSATCFKLCFLHLATYSGVSTMSASCQHRVSTPSVQYKWLSGKRFMLCLLHLTTFCSVSTVSAPCQFGVSAV